MTIIHYFYSTIFLGYLIELRTHKPVLATQPFVKICVFFLINTKLTG